VWVWV